MKPSKNKSQIQLIREAVRMLNECPQLTKRWPFKVNLHELKMWSNWHCVLGQLFGEYTRGMDTLGLDVLDTCPHGFDSYISAELWKTKIRQLRVSYQKALERKRRRR